MSSQGVRPDYRREVGGGTPKIQSASSVLNRQRHIAHIAQKYTDSPLTTLAYHMDSLWMHEAFSRVKKKLRPGVGPRFFIVDRLLFEFGKQRAVPISFRQ